MRLKILSLCSLIITLICCTYSPPKYNPRGKLALDKTEIILGLFSYYCDHDCFPAEETGLEVLVPQYIKDRKSIIDQWGNAYQFKIRYLENDTCEISVISMGKDKQIGGKGDNQDEIYKETTTGHKPK